MGYGLGWEVFLVASGAEGPRPKSLQGYHVPNVPAESPLLSVACACATGVFPAGRLCTLTHPGAICREGP